MNAAPHQSRVALHLRTLSGNTPHPRAIEPILFLAHTGDFQIEMEQSMIRVMGHLLGVYLATYDANSDRFWASLVIWDWVTARQITVRVDSHSLETLH